jgi:hemolysin activation/secretion protein
MPVSGKAARVLFGLALLAPASAWGQAVPPQINPGAIGNENQRQQQQLENREPQPQIAPQNAPVTGPAAPQPGGTTAGPAVNFVLNGVTFDHSQFLTQEQLDTVAKAYLGQSVDFGRLSELVEKINSLYRTLGQITARAVLAPQSIAGGIVHITLIEGKLGQVDIKGAARVQESFVRDRITPQPGDTVDANLLSRDVVYFNRTNDAQLRALLKPGRNFGQTDIDLNVTEPPSDTLQLFVDNYGVASTGRLEGGVYYRHNDLLGLDDRLLVYGTASGGGLDGSISYNLPFTTEGDRVSLSYERNHIDIINGQFQALSITGNGQTGTLGLSHPVLGTEHWLVLATLNGAIGTSTTTEPAGAITDTTTYRGVLGGSATYIGSDILANLSPALTFASSHNAITAGNRDITFFSGSGSALLPFDDGWSVHVAAAWQFAQEKILPSDLLFQIGGPTSVRGYQSGTFAGDSGFYTNLELHKQIPAILQGLDLFAAFDSGMVFADSPSEQSLTSVAFGAQLTLPYGTSLNAGIGLPLDHATPDQDDAILYLQLAAHL